MLTLEGFGLGHIKNCLGLEPGLLLLPPLPQLGRVSCMIHMAKVSLRIKCLNYGTCPCCHLKVVPHKNENHTKFMLASSGTRAVKPLHVAVGLKLDCCEQSLQMN